MFFFFVFSGCIDPECKELSEISRQLLAGTIKLPTPPAQQLLTKHPKKHVEKKQLKENVSVFIAPFDDPQVVHTEINRTMQNIGTGRGQGQQLSTVHVTHGLDSVTAHPHIVLSIPTQCQTFTGKMRIRNTIYYQKQIMARYRKYGLVTVHPSGTLYDANGQEVGDPIVCCKRERRQRQENQNAAAEGRPPKTISYKEARMLLIAENKKVREDYLRERKHKRAESEAGIAPGQTGPSAALKAGIVPGQTGPSAALKAGIAPGQPGPSAALKAGIVPGQPGPSAALKAGIAPGQPGPSAALKAGIAPGQPGPSAALKAGIVPGQPGPSAAHKAGIAPGQPGQAPGRARKRPAGPGSGPADPKRTK